MFHQHLIFYHEHNHQCHYLQQHHFIEILNLIYQKIILLFRRDNEEHSNVEEMNYAQFKTKSEKSNTSVETPVTTEQVKEFFVQQSYIERILLFIISQNQVYLLQQARMIQQQWLLLFQDRQQQNLMFILIMKKHQH